MVEVFSYSGLPDPYKDRQVSEKQCPSLINQPMSDSQLFKNDIPDWKLLKDFMQREGPVTKTQCMRLLRMAYNIFKSEPNMVQIDEPICVVGDLHGQYFDLLNMISKAGEPGTINYLFLGDYVDRGILGIEVCLLLFAIKINHPKSV